MHIRSILARRVLPIEELDAAIEAYQCLFNQPLDCALTAPEKNLRIAQVAQLLLIGGNDTSLKPFHATLMTFLVHDIEAYAACVPAAGGSIVRPIQQVPSGRNMLVRQADRAPVEYVEHDHPNPADDTLAALL